MSRGRKSAYPERPLGKSRPKSSNSGGGKRKGWMSLRTSFEGGRDTSPRLGFAWWKSPMFKDARMKRWAK